jgi:Asp-tRNA(Asn)/Glu-tRNA(Gln) amidotransferase A subunit family amidase
VSIARGDHYGVLHELCFEPACRLIAMLLAREVSSTELTSGLYERIRKVNPKLKAVVTLRPGEHPSLPDVFRWLTDR